MIPSGYSGELGDSGESVECSTSGGGDTPLSFDGPSRGACGGGGALRGGNVYVYCCK